MTQTSSNPIDLSSELASVGPVHIKDSFIEPAGYHKDDVGAHKDYKHLLTDSARPRPRDHRSFIFQPYFSIQPNDSFQADKPHLFYETDDSTKAPNPIQPARPKPHYRPSGAHTIETTIQATDLDLIRDNRERPVTAYETGRQHLEEFFDLAEQTISEYITWRQTQEKPRRSRDIQGILAGEPWVQAPHSARHPTSLLTPTLTVYGRKA